MYGRNATSGTVGLPFGGERVHVVLRAGTDQRRSLQRIERRAERSCEAGIGDTVVEPRFADMNVITEFCLFRVFARQQSILRFGAEIAVIA